MSDFEDDDVPSVGPQRITSGASMRGSSATPRDVTLITAELEADEYQFPVSRTKSSNHLLRGGVTRDRVEQVYDLLKNGAFFDGPNYHTEGLTAAITTYIRGTSGWTFLHQAAFHQHERAVEWLIKNGADKTIRGRFDGKTPYDVALTNGKAKGSTKIMEMLEVRGTAGAPPHGWR